MPNIASCEVVAGTLSDSSGSGPPTPESKVIPHSRAAGYIVGGMAFLLILGSLLAGHPFQLAVTNISMVLIALAIGGFATVRWRDSLSLLRNVFWTRDSAVNLAIFRIVTFGTLLALIWQDVNMPALLPKELWAVPLELQRIFELAPPDNVLVSAARTICTALCLTGMLGMFTRVSAALCAALGFYILGLQESMRVSHVHHVIWFLILLMACRSADKLSIGSVFYLNRRAERSLHYGVPLRFVWLLIGVIYFFPGFYKLWSVGVEWIWTDNLVKMVMERSFDGQRHAWLLKLPAVDLCSRFGAFAVILFECTFITLIFMGETVRARLAAASFVFHNLSYVILRIHFAHLQSFLPLLLNCQRHFLAIGRRLFRLRLSVSLKSDCKRCLLVGSAIHQFDLLRRVIPTFSVSTPGTIDFHANGHCLPEHIGRRVPLVVPFVAASRWMQLLLRTAQVHTYSRMDKPYWALALGCSLALVCCVYGFAGAQMGWPFAAYPLFNFRVEGRLCRLSAELHKVDGTCKPVWLVHSIPRLKPYAIGKALQRVLSNSRDEQRELILLICKKASSCNPEWQGVHHVNVFKNGIQLAFDFPAGRIRERQLLFNFTRDELSSP